MRPSAIAVTEAGDVSLKKRPDRSAMVGLYLLRTHEEASPRASATLNYAWADPKGRARALGRAGLDGSPAAARVSRETYPKPTPGGAAVVRHNGYRGPGRACSAARYPRWAVMLSPSALADAAEDTTRCNVEQWKKARQCRFEFGEAL